MCSQLLNRDTLLSRFLTRRDDQFGVLTNTSKDSFTSELRMYWLRNSTSQCQLKLGLKVKQRPTDKDEQHQPVRLASVWEKPAGLVMPINWHAGYTHTCTHKRGSRGPRGEPSQRQVDQRGLPDHDSWFVISSCFLKSFSEFTASVSSNRVMMPGMSFILLFIRAIPDTGEKFIFILLLFLFLSFFFLLFFFSHWTSFKDKLINGTLVRDY